jgi:DNA gyrase subunit A
MTPENPAPAPAENITDLLIEDELRDSYLKYAMSVIVARALPDVRDGLKPSQRRILVAMNDLGLGPRAKFRKCAKIAGDTSGNYHPHGESVVYPTLVRLAQDFVMRTPLVDGQGNFGNIDGSPPAAMRYTEARLTGPAMELLEDLDKETVDLQRNYDDTRDEPTVLPARLPNLLVNGANGIAVGMASNIPPHNLREICDALIAIIENPSLSVQELMEIVPGPDFPTGGLICGRQGIADAYATGRGRIVMRARSHVEEMKGGRRRIVFTTIPYNVNLTTVIESIAEGVHSGRIDGIPNDGLRDESDMNGVRLVVECKRDHDAEVVLNNLFQHTQLQDSFGVNAIALVNGRPETLPLREMLLRFRDHRVEVIRRRTRFLLREAEKHAHILEGLRIALDHIDAVIALIRASKDTAEAREGLRAKFGLTAIQANAILDMRLQRLTGLERDKLEKEYAEVMEKIAEYRAILADEKLVLQMIIADLEELKAQHGNDRRTEITGEAAVLGMEDLVPLEQVIVTLSREGYVKRTPVAAYRTRHRGGKGVTGAETKDEDHLVALYVASTHDYLLFFTDRGRIHWLRVYNVPVGARAGKGRALVNLLHLAEGEKVASVIPVDAFDGGRMLVMATRRGLVKKTALEEYSRPRTAGIIGIKLEEGDGLVDVVLTNPGQDLLLATAGGYALRFHGDAVRPMGRDTMGVYGIRLRGEGDEVVSLLAIEEGISVLTVGEKGMGKRTPVEDYPVKGRGGMGVINVRVTEKNGRVVAVLPVRDDDDVLFITREGMIVRTRVGSFRSIGRATQGVRLVTLGEGDAVVDVSRVVREEEGEEKAAQAPPDAPAAPATS